MNTKENAVPLRRRISDAHNKKGSDLSGQNPFCCTFRCNSNAKQLSFFCRELFLCQNTRIKQRFIALELLYGIAACRRGRCGRRGLCSRTAARLRGVRRDELHQLV